MHSRAPLPFSSDGDLLAAASRWIVRRDRGLMQAEARELESWLAADPRHAAAFKRCSAAWAMLDRAPEKKRADFREPAVQARRSWPLRGFAAAAALAVAGLAWWWSARSDGGELVPAPPHLFGPQLARLEDGSAVRLDAGAELAREFTATERGVRLVRGEAFFEVAHAPARPFVVRAGAVAARAVGTAFDLALQETTVRVLVTEGRVALAEGSPAADRPLSARADPLAWPVLGANQRAVVVSAPGAERPAFAVANLSADEVERALAWRVPLLRFDGATLAEVVREFERHGGRRLVLVDPELASLRVGGRFRADDVDGFLRVLEENFAVRAERDAVGVVFLRSQADLPVGPMR